MKNFFVTIILILASFFLINCSSKNENLIKPKKTIPLELLYNEAYKKFYLIQKIILLTIWKNL